MKRWLLPATAVLCIGCAEPRGGSEWTVMTWNTQNLFDGNDDGSEYPEFDPGSGNWDDRLYRRRLERAGQVVFGAFPSGPDLLVLQEIENARVLDDLADGPLRKAGYRWRLAAPGDGAVRCGVLSRHPLSETAVVSCGTWRDRDLRPVLGFTVEVPAGRVRVLALHWKSPRDGRAVTEEARRLEASAVESAILEALSETPDAAVLALGDLNTPGDGGFTPAALGPWNTENGNADGAVLHRTPRAVDAGIRNGELVLFDPNPASGPPGTYWFRGSWDRPDRALMTAGLLDAEGPRFLECRVAADTAGNGEERPVRWITDLEEGFSDHLPLVLVFGAE